MNNLEQLIYNAVKSRPWLKFLLRNAYQGMFDLLPQKKEFSLNPIEHKEGYFFGFHDITPFSYDDSRILANALKFDLKMPSKSDEIDVGYFDFIENRMGNFCKLGATRSWNYHKGCRLQWLSEDTIIFNKADDNDCLRSEILNIANKSVRTIDYPIDSVSKDGKFASSFSYERLEEFMPGYGYAFKDDDSFLDHKAPKETGLFLVNLENNTRELIISLEKLSILSRDEDISSEAYHYVTHSEFSPDGNYVSFFHRWVGEDTRKRYTRLVIYNVTEGSFKIAPTGYMVSHYVWNSQNEIVAYCNYKGVDSHVLLDVENFEESVRVGYPFLNSDGHQSFISQRSFVTDTYPDKYRMAKLFKVDIGSNEVVRLASIYSPKKFQTRSFSKHIACDLHPRVSNNGNYVCFDTVRTGKRSLAVMSLKKS